ncbi:hypothetical protein N9B17_03235 [Rhodopirellula sp.]|nr:hypothetical protein [Rhodopirellula sp.]
MSNDQASPRFMGDIIRIQHDRYSQDCFTLFRNPTKILHEMQYDCLCNRIASARLDRLLKMFKVRKFSRSEIKVSY